jgi:hypothetical protein
MRPGGGTDANDASQVYLGFSNTGYEFGLRHFF